MGKMEWDKKEKKRASKKRRTKQEKKFISKKAYRTRLLHLCNAGTWTRLNRLQYALAMMGKVEMV